MDAKDFLNNLNKYPEFLRQKAAREAQVASQREADRVIERDLLSSLADIGLRVQSVWDLVNSSDPYPAAIPILMEHLRIAYPDRVREGIARALTVPDADSFFGELIDLFCSLSDHQYPRTKWAIGNAIGKLLHADRLSQAKNLLLDDTHSRRSRRAIYSYFARWGVGEDLLRQIDAKISYTGDEEDSTTR
jgi:hypothetical protein